MWVRPPAVAGLFYPSSDLRATVRRLVDDAGPRLAQVPGAPKALIVPHAGYPYSGSTAALGYALAGRSRDTLTRVVLLGPCHRVAVRGLALSSADAWETPLGRIRLETDTSALAGLRQVVTSDAAHEQEHSLEVQVPFLQVVLGDVVLLPLAVGEATAQEVAEVIEALWGGPETLLVISSDLSHYLRYEQARRADEASIEQILALRAPLDHHQACGATPVNGLLVAARRRGLVPTLLGSCNSGDTAGDKHRVVGYASVAFSVTVPAAEPDVPASQERQPTVPGNGPDGDPHGLLLLGLARAAIAGRLHLRVEPPVPDETASRPGAAFVTLTVGGRLRGCIGSLEAYRSLAEDVAANAEGAAFADPRFPPLTREEFDRVRIEVSVLSPPRPLPVKDRNDARARLRPGVDGVVLHAAGRRATFLPQVWEQLPEPDDFLGHLLAKAGLRPDFWDDSVRLERYTVTAYHEEAEP